MAKQREGRLARKIMLQLRDHKVFCFKVHGSEHMMAGLPDVIACVDGFFVGFEVKLPETRENTSARQKYVHTRITESGGIAIVVCSPEEALAVVAEIRDRESHP